MPLTIEGATVGYNKTGVDKLKEDIKAEMIDKAAEHMQKNLDSLNTEIDNIWQGKSADLFKANMKKDVDTISNALYAAHEALDRELNAIISEMSDVDQELIKAK